MDKIKSTGFAFGKATSGKNSSDVLPSRFLPCKTFSDFVSLSFDSMDEAVLYANAHVPMSMDIAIEQMYKCQNNGDADDDWRYGRQGIIERVKGTWEALDNDWF